MTGVVSDFVGDWILQRQITDRYLNQTGVFSGLATLQPLEPDVLKYSENGKVRLGEGPCMSATRDYVWRFVGNRVEVKFVNGDAFHIFVPAGAVDGTDHPCGDDFYRVHYDFLQWPEWTVTWTVSGPRKDYTSVSRYVRAV